MRLIGVVGLPGSGKGEFSRCAAKLGIPVLVMGDVIRRVAQERGLPLEDDVLGRISGQLREQYGRGAIARLMLDDVRAQRAPVVLIDGIRSDAEVDEFRSAVPGFTLVGVESSFTTRLGRLAGRGRSDDLSDASGLHRRDERELGWGLGTALSRAERTLKNEGNLDEFRRDVQSLLLDLRENA
ncbi:AAA domain protein [anaerobic digester metagenome]